jgi:hypothetical protein
MPYDLRQTWLSAAEWWAVVLGDEVPVTFHWFDDVEMADLAMSLRFLRD